MVRSPLNQSLVKRISAAQESEPMTKEQKTVAHTSHAENGTKQNEDASSAISDETDEKASKVGQENDLESNTVVLATPGTKVVGGSV